MSALKAEAEEEKKRAVEAARQRVLNDFEKTHLGLSAKTATSTPPATPSTTDFGRSLPAACLLQVVQSHRIGREKKRKFEFDTTEVERLTREAEEDALLRLEKEQAEVLRAKLPDFWLPSLTPTYTSKGPPRSLTEIKLQTACRGGNPSHKLSYVTHHENIFTVSTPCIRKKDLITVRFSYPSTVDLQWHKQPRPTAPAEEPPNPRKVQVTENPICPSCRKELTNSSRIFCKCPYRVIRSPPHDDRDSSDEAVLSRRLQDLCG